MFIKTPFPHAFGLEIGDLSIKLIQLDVAGFFKKGCLKVKDMRATTLPAGLIVNGEIQQPELVRKKLLHLLGRDENKRYPTIKTPWVVASLPEVKTFLKLIKIEVSPSDLTEADVLYQAKKHLPFELAEAYTSWQSVNSQEAKYSRVLIGSVPKVTADSYTYLLESVQLTPISLEIEAIALARALITDGKDYTGEARAILDLGATRSSLVIYDHHSVQFSTSLNFSGEIVTTAIEQNLKISHQEAEELKINNGARYNDGNAKYLNIITKINDRLIKELASAFDFYQAHFKNQNPINHITMSGGMSNWKGLDSIISKKLKISARPGNPWKNLLNDKQVYDKNDGLAMSVAIGLALKASQRPFII